MVFYPRFYKVNNSIVTFGNYFKNLSEKQEN